MNWVNENSGVIVLIMSIVIIAMTAVVLWLLFYLKSKIAVQKLTFLGFYSIQLDERNSYAQFTVGNKSLNDVGIAEFGIRNGKVNFNITSLYREKAGIGRDAKIVIEQRGSVSFQLTAEELKKAIVIGQNGKPAVKTLRLYAVDLTGTLHQGTVHGVRKLLKELNAQELAAAKYNSRQRVCIGAAEVKEIKAEPAVSFTEPEQTEDGAQIVESDIREEPTKEDETVVS